MFWFESQDGSTSQGHILHDVLVQFDSPDGSTNWGHLINDILV